MKGLVWINLVVAGWLMFTSWSVPDDPIARTSRVEGPAALVLAPFVLRYNPWNDVLAGLMAVSMAVLVARHEYATVD